MKKLAAIWALFVLAGFWFFRMKDLNDERWWDLYYVWDKGKDLIAALAIGAGLKNVKGLSLLIKIIIPFLIWRVLWEPIRKLFKLQVNEPWENFIFILVLAGSLLVYSLTEIKWRKRK